MEINPQRVRSAEFKMVRKGVDPEEVRVFLVDVADELERAQNQSTAMEARARAAVARLQELNDNAAAAPVEPSADESETISRTLLLAQRTADTTVAEARAEAARLIAEAKDEAAKTLDSTRAMSARLMEEARAEARRLGEVERESVAGEVEALKARREFLESDVHHLETFLVDQRARVREAASSLLEVVDRVPGGLGEVRMPLLSASDDEAGGDDAEVLHLADEAVHHTDDQPAVADRFSDVDVDAGADAGVQEESGDGNAAGEAAAALDDVSWAEDAASGADATEAMSSIALDDTGESELPSDEPATEPADEPAADSGSEFRFSFDDERS
jgi:DivIVA domain-containing protein